MISTAAQIQQMVRDGIGDRLLLSHPFYRRWESGALRAGELARYAEQYRHIEAALPTVLTQIQQCLPPGPARDSVDANLADELGRPEPHLQLFNSFLQAASGRADAAAGAAARSLVDLQLTAASNGPVQGIAVLAAYESQAADVASSKSTALRQFYGMEEGGTAFWDVHAEMESEHTDWSLDALSSLGAQRTEVVDAVGAASRAWWGFLDEREAERFAA